MKRSAIVHFWFRRVVQLQTSPSQEQGYILVVVMGLLLILGSLFLASGLTSKVDKASNKALEENSTAFYAAEAGLNLRAEAIRAKFIDYNRPSGTSPANWSACRDNNGNPVNAGSGDFGCQAIDNQFKAIVDRENAASLADKLKGIRVSTYIAEAPGNPKTILVPANEQFAGLSAQEYRYDVVSVAYASQSSIGQKLQPAVMLTMSFKSRLVPLFQFAAFYQNDMDLTRPAPMTLHGPIHTNSNLYLNAGDDVTIYGQISSAGRMYRGEKANGETCNPGYGRFTGTLRIHDPKLDNGTATADNPVVMPCTDSPKTEITTDASYNNVSVGGTLVNNWNGQIRPGIQRLTVPSTSFLDAKLPDASNTYEYWNKADLRIALRLNSGSEEPESIEVVKPDQTIDRNATDSLNSSTCLPTSTTVTDGFLDKRKTVIKVASTDGFEVGNAIKFVRSNPKIDDFDENVITEIDSVEKTITLARPLGQQDIDPGAGEVTVQKAIVWSSKTFYNYREKTLSTAAELAQKGRLIRMLNVDMQGVLSCAKDLMGGKELNEESDGGLVWHFTVLGPNSNNDTSKTSPDLPNSYGIRLYNGAKLASLNPDDPAIKGLTIASDQPVYIRGDYNSIDKKPAAVLADSLNAFSNNSPLNDRGSCTDYTSPYNASDCTEKTGLDQRVASDTTINAAFLAGVDITGNVNGEPSDGKSSGGLNNYIRLHEKWNGGPRLTYRGSMVSLGKARRVNGPFCGVGPECNIYSAPRRNWDYDTDFNDAAKLPPLSPRFVFLRQERFSRNYEQEAMQPLPFGFASLPLNKWLSVLPPWISVSVQRPFEAPIYAQTQP